MYNMTVFYLCLGGICGGATLQDITYNADIAYSGKVPADTSPLSVRSLYECASVCSSDTVCRGFYYLETPRECYPVNGTMLTYFHLNVSAVYFAKSDEVEANDRVVSTTSCPLTFQNNILLLGTSGNYYTFTIINNSVNQSEAVTACGILGLQLLKVNDETKMLDLAEFLTACPAYANSRYWAGAMRPELDQPWTNSDGTVASMTNIWCSNDNGNACVRLRPNACKHLLNDFPCSNIAYFVCE